MARELVTRDDFRSSDDPVPEHTVRVNFHCNQSCEFCFVSTHLPPAAEAAIRAAIDDAGRAGAVLVLSGGEPTLNSHLVEYVERAKRQGVRKVELQTNAIRLADPMLTRRLAEAGLDGAMVSLHGSTAEMSDAITAAPGTFVSTVRGIDELTQTAVHVRLNFVFCQTNRNDFARFIDLVAARWPTASVVFSFVGSHTDVVPRTTALIPSFSAVMPSLISGLARARAAGIHVQGFESMCGLPLCLVPEVERANFRPHRWARMRAGGNSSRATSARGAEDASLLRRAARLRRALRHGGLRPLSPAGDAAARPAESARLQTEERCDRAAAHSAAPNSPGYRGR